MAVCTPIPLFNAPVQFNKLLTNKVDFTTGNLLLTVPSMDKEDEDGIYRRFGPPVTGVLETESGSPPGFEAPRYIL